MVDVMLRMREDWRAERDERGEQGQYNCSPSVEPSYLLTQGSVSPPFSPHVAGFLRTWDRPNHAVV